MSCDDLLVRVGEMGLFQVYFLALMGLTKIVCGSHVLLSVFAAYRRPYWCALWGNMTTHEYQCSLTDNSSSTFSDTTARMNDTSVCPEEAWQFDDSIIATTIQSQYGLICDKEMLVPLATTFFMAGFLVGCSFYGFLSDRFGRVKVSSILALHALIVSLGVSFAPYLELYIIGRFLMGIAVGGILTIANSSCIEILTARWRLLGITMASLLWIVGNYFVLLVSYLERRHNYLQLYISFTALPGLLSYFILPEPLRWLIVNDHIDEAYKTAQKIARINKKPPLTREEFDEYLARITKHDDKKEDDLSTWQKFKGQFRFLYYENLRRVTFIMWFLFAATSFITYSFAFSIGRFDDNVYRNVLIMNVISPAKYILLYTFGHLIGRVKLLTTCYALTAIATFALIGLYKVELYSHYAIWVALVAKFFVIVCFLLIWLAGNEIYPTQFRTSAVGSSSTWARVGALLSPQVIYLDLVWRPLPFIIYGTVCVLAAIASIFLPETKGIPTLETVRDSESFVKHNRLWRKQWLPDNLEIEKQGIEIPSHEDKKDKR